MPNNDLNKELLRIVIAGSVDDGKSTLLGRLFYDTDQIYEDQLNALKRASKEFEEGEIDFSLFTDGLSAEREQKITIDVAYRYFNLGKRRLIIADVPGHEQYTRNMVTGASNANAVLIITDARKGLLPQSKRHLFIASLLGIPHVLVVVNKMDLVSYQRDVFEAIKQDFTSFSAKLRIPDLQFIPISSLKGDMVVTRGENLNWYQGTTIYHYLESLEISSDVNLIDFRLPVQNVLRPNQDTRLYAGQVESGSIKKGERIMVFPSARQATIKNIWTAGSEDIIATAPTAVMLELNEQIDISRGDVIAREKNPPEIATAIEAYLCWMSDSPLSVGKKYLIKHGTKNTGCAVSRILHSIDIHTLHRQDAEKLSLNEIGKIKLQTHEPICFDSYQKNRSLGSFILIDPDTNGTVAAGMISRKAELDGATKTVNKNQEQPKQKGVVLWFTGLSGSGKTTIAEALCKELEKIGLDYEHLDGDVMRGCLSKGLGFSKKDRDTNIERAAYIARLLAKHGVIVVASFISPYKKHREIARQGVDNFIEIFVDTPIEICEQRDIKGLYKKARAGEIKDFTGIDDPYEIPTSPNFVIAEQDSVAESVEKLMGFFMQNY